jgi:hypothetical protein
MRWSGQDALLAEFLSRFRDRQLAVDALRDYVKTARVLDDRWARVWLNNALARDQELARIADPPDEVLGPSRYQPRACFHCSGRGRVRLDVDSGHPDFGKSKPCPACYGRDHPEHHCERCAAFAALFATVESDTTRNQCWKCGAFEDEDARPGCSNPRWHTRIQSLPSPAGRDYVTELATQMKAL